jgi:carbon-monoxide dehydrogenase medium subunit
MGVLRGKSPGEAVFAKAAAAAAAEAKPIDDLRGSVAFRRELVEILTRRALDVCVARAQGGRS